MLSWMLISALISAVTLAIAIQKRDAPKSRYFIVLAIVITLYCLGRAFESAATGLESAYYGVILSYIGLPYIPIIMLLFLLDYYDIKINKKPWLVLFIPLLLTSIFVTVPELRHIYYAEYTFLPGPPIAQIAIEPTIYYYAMFAYHALLNVLCLSLALWGAIKHGKTERKSSLIVFIAVILPAVAEVLYVLRLTPMRLEIAPLAMAVSTMLLCLAVFEHNLLRVLPMAKGVILDKMSDAFILTDMEYHFLEANEAATNQFPILADMRVGDIVNVADLFPNVNDGTESRTLVYVETETEGSHKYYHLVENIIEQNEKKRCICYTLHDVTEARNLMEELKTMATYDALTQIYNRASFYKLASHELEHSSAQRTNVTGLAIDIDKFKTINDTYGHYCGDLVIKDIVQKITGRLRKSDIFGRVGGDEFNIILPNTKLESATVLAESLQELISAEQFEYEENKFPVTISIGVAMYDDQRHAGLKELLIDMDSALYKSKNAGRNTVCAFNIEEAI